MMHLAIRKVLERWKDVILFESLALASDLLVTKNWLTIQKQESVLILNALEL